MWSLPALKVSVEFISCIKDERLTCRNLHTIFCMMNCRDSTFSDIPISVSHLRKIRCDKLHSGWFFCKETGNNAWLKTRYGAELASLTVNVVSFHNIDALNNDQCETLFVKPPDAPDLNASEVLYLYRTLIDIILQIAEIAQIQVLTFQAYSEELRRIYDRLVKRYVLTRNLHIMTEGAYYVIRTGRRKDERSN